MELVSPERRGCLSSPSPKDMPKQRLNIQPPPPQRLHFQPGPKPQVHPSTVTQKQCLGAGCWPFSARKCLPHAGFGEGHSFSSMKFPLKSQSSVGFIFSQQEATIPDLRQPGSDLSFFLVRVVLQNSGAPELVAWWKFNQPPKGCPCFCPATGHGTNNLEGSLLGRLRSLLFLRLRTGPAVANPRYPGAETDPAAQESQWSLK